MKDAVGIKNGSRLAWPARRTREAAVVDASVNIGEGRKPLPGVALWIGVNEPPGELYVSYSASTRRTGENKDVEWKTAAARKEKQIELGCIFSQLSITPSVN